MRRRSFALAFVLTALAGCAGDPRTSSGASCPSSTPIVDTAIDAGTVVRNDMSMGDMAEDALRLLGTAAGGFSMRDAAQRHYLGQSVTKTRLDARLEAENVSVADARSCAMPHRLELMLRFVRREMRVATETRADPCLEREVEAHEVRHIALDDEIIAAFGPVLEVRARELALALHAVPGATFEMSKAHLADRLREGVRLLHGEFEAARARRHLSEIDTEEEYNRVFASCGGKARVVVASPR